MFKEACTQHSIVLYRVAIIYQIYFNHCVSHTQLLEKAQYFKQEVTLPDVQQIYNAVQQMAQISHYCFTVPCFSSYQTPSAFHFSLEEHLLFRGECFPKDALKSPMQDLHI